MNSHKKTLLATLKYTSRLYNQEAWVSGLSTEKIICIPLGVVWNNEGSKPQEKNNNTYPMQ